MNGTFNIGPPIEPLFLIYMTLCEVSAEITRSISFCQGTTNIDHMLLA
jgi:hypothetical protein